ncbi:alpha-mannosidase [Clostridium swellfunianum]|uniref:alpha-mannosidase n=1 Tax=Clostridium swellfunianum TaxID=1367462 RepID=UPI00202E02AE|nr:alpha-mannosidase [Clostridium swellfunianum]MCM0649657.1 alpha-mannosidase [Clostridium swellfunianum]
MFFVEKKTERRLEEIFKFIYRQRMDLGLKYRQDGTEEYKDTYRGLMWGGKNVLVWFKSPIITLPESYINKKVALYLELSDYTVPSVNPESLIYVNGTPIQGCDKNHREIVVPKELIKDGKLEVNVKAFSGRRDYKNKFLYAEVVTIDEKTENLYLTMKMALHTALTLPKDDYMRGVILSVIDNTLNLIDWREEGSDNFYDSIYKALFYIKEELKAAAGRSKRPEVTCIGHSHIDVAWYWQLWHTREKVSRTFSTVLNLMKQYPDYYFLQSQPQLYKYIKEDYPEIYEKIKERVAEGRWEATGGMWVEADSNVTSGESLVRQLLFGTRFFKKEFGVDNKLVWLPDAFGFSGNLPQIMKKSGFDYFLTTKISWNQFNRPPYDTFRWRGLDGSEVLTHFMTMPENAKNPEDWGYTYNGDINPYSFKRVWENYRHKDINSKDVLISFGHGDGGGGTTRDMIESIYISEDMPVMPKAKMGKAEDFFKRLEAEVAENKHLDTWDGELYLEVHRGTLTSQAKTKKYNRQSEIVLHDVEALNTFAKTVDRNANYHQEEINNAWELVLLNQFHDIIPGSSITEVYEDSDAQYKEVLSTGNRLKAEVLNNLASKVKTEGPSLVIFNTLSWKRDGYIYVEKASIAYESEFVDGDSVLSSQIVEKNGKSYYMIFVKDVPSYGYKTVKVTKKGSNSHEDNISVNKTAMENKFFKIVLNDKGQLVSIFDKTNNKEVLAEGKLGNVLSAYEDKPFNFDAWDIDIYYKDKQYVVDNLVSAEVVSQGAERGTLKLVWKYMNSDIVQYVHLYNNVARVDFETEIDWKEKQTLLKTAFPVDVRSTKATYEIQFGSIERTTHNNTPWDYGQFEVTGHKWTDLSERNFGVSLLNDCKYGHSIKNNVIELSLLKSAIEPDPFADKCHHSFTYSLYPHKGDWFEGATVQEGYSLNFEMPVVYVEKTAGQLPSSDSFVENAIPGVIVETVKKAEDCDHTVIRMYEYGNGTTAGEIRFNKKIKEAFLCDMMEKNEAPIAFEGNKINLEFTPFELKCLMVDFE